MKKMKKQKKMKIMKLLKKKMKIKTTISVKEHQVQNRPYKRKCFFHQDSRVKKVIQDI